MRVMDGESERTVGFDSGKLPSYHLGARHEEIDHGHAVRKPGARVWCTPLRSFASAACAVQIRVCHYGNWSDILARFGQSILDESN